MYALTTIWHTLEEHSSWKISIDIVIIGWGNIFILKSSLNFRINPWIINSLLKFKEAFNMKTLFCMDTSCYVVASYNTEGRGLNLSVCNWQGTSWLRNKSKHCTSGYYYIYKSMHTMMQWQDHMSKHSSIRHT